MFSLICWITFGIVVGLIAKFLHPGDEPVGFIPTLAIGIAGTFIGGLINWVMDFGKSSFEPSGFLFSIVGGIIFCAAWRWYNLTRSLDGPKDFFTGKNIK